MLDVRQCADAIDQLARERRPARRGVAGLQQVNRRELGPTRVEARIGGTGRLQRAHEQAGDDHEQQAERHLRDHERMPEPLPVARLRIVLQRGDDVGLRGLKRWRETREDCRDEHEPDGEQQRSTIEAKRYRHGERQRRKEWGQKRREADGQHHAGDAAQRAQHQRFGEQLAHQPRPPRADREPHRDFLTTRRRAREQHAGQVGAGDHEHERHDRGQ